jgi:Sulfotransferase domain
MPANGPTLPGFALTMEVGCVRLRMAGAELRLEPLSEETHAVFRTRLFVATHRSHERQVGEGDVARVHQATLAWEGAMHQVAPGLEEMPAMHALHLLALHLTGASLSDQATEARRVIEASGRRDVSWREVPRLAYQRRLPDGVRAQVHALSEHPPASLMAAPHVVVTGPGRSGTRWVLECASRLVSLASPALTVSSPLVGQETNARHPYPGWTDRISRYNAYFPPSDAPAVKDALAGVGGVRSVALACPASATIVTKVGPWRSAWRWSAAFRQTRVVRVERDPRNVFVSSRRFRRRSGSGAAAFAAFLAASFAQAFADRALRGYERRPLVMRYEHMLADLEGQLQRLAKGLDVATSREVLAMMARELTFEAMAGRPYGELRDGDYFRGGSDWTRELDNAERRVARLFDPLITSLGYPKAPP